MGPDATGSRAAGPDATGSRAAGSVVRRLAVVMLVLLAGAAIVLAVLERRAEEQDRLGEQASVAAVSAMTAVLDYRPDSVAEDLAAAEPLLTDPFLDRFRQQSRELTVPRSIAGQVSSSARSVGAAIASLESERALVVVYLDRHTVGRDGIPHVLQTVVEVGLLRTSETWLVSEVTPR